MSLVILSVAKYPQFKVYFKFLWIFRYAQNDKFFVILINFAIPNTSEVSTQSKKHTAGC